jgi:hypothetical protein
MRYPKLKAPEKRRVLIDRFRGYEHLPEVSAGAFYDMKNCSGEPAPLLTVRARRTEVQALEGCPTDRVLALGGRGTPVVLDADGTLWCGGQALPRLLDGTPSLSAADELDGSVEISDADSLLAALGVPGLHRFRYVASMHCWTALDGDSSLAASVLNPGELTDGLVVRVSYAYTPASAALRQLVFLGGWVCVFPDGKYANTVRLRQGQPMAEGEDWGTIAQRNCFEEGGTLFTPCDADGTPRTVVWSDTAPAQGCWVDTSEETPTLRAWSQSQGLWVDLVPYVKCEIPGIAKGLRAGDSVVLDGRFDSNQGGEAQTENVWTGTKVLAAAWHDPGSDTRPEGRNDYVVIPGLLPEAYEIELTWHDRGWLSAARPMPEMDFVVEAGNRLWGCRCGGGINELYGSKLGDFRNWLSFEGLSTDSYRVTRGHDGPYTGAAVLGGCPLFFRADCLEKLYPSAGGDHGVVTVSLEGIEAGSAASAVVIRDRLFYKSPGGICCYNGTLPARVSKALGAVSYHAAAAGARGSRYYVSMLDAENRPNLFVLDTETGLWYREDDCRFAAAYSQGEHLWLLPRPGCPLLCVGEATDSRNVVWWAETGDLAPRMAVRRCVTRMQVTAKLDPGSELRVYLSYDGGAWLRKGELKGNELKSVTFPVLARRCGRLRLRLEGLGGMELHSLSWLTEPGSDV